MRPLLLFCAFALAAAGQNAPARGPLRILPTNPRYFTDGSGTAIYLAGSHNWNTFQDNGHRSGGGDPPPVFDYSGHLDFLQAHNHNFFRLWRWEATTWMDDEPLGIKFAQPHPWIRSGAGMANDEKPKFDLSKFSPEYFDRMRSRIIAARDRGMYVSVMLFEGWEMQFLNAWTYHPYNAANNANGVDADANQDGKGLEYCTIQKSPMGKRVLAFQEAYLRQVMDTVNDLDNVLYEVCNEAGAYSTDWQYHIIDYVHRYEAGKPKQHPVGMTFQYRGGTNRELFNSPADWISPNTGDPPNSYLENPPANFSGKVIVNDTDHLCGHTCGDAVWVWKSFCRGLNILFMEELPPSPVWHDSARDAMGQTRRYAGKINLAEMTPHDELATTRYCLAKPGSEYLVFQPGGQGEFRVNLSDAQGGFSVEWFNVYAGATVPGKPVQGGGMRIFITPFGGPAVLHLRSIHDK
ncbi:MAG: hypothetical protein AAB225_13230 [Acidobacteriota bacterium]